MSEEEITLEKVIEALKMCYDPEIPVNIVDLGLIYDIQINRDERSVYVKMTLTAPGCPVGFLVVEQVKGAIMSMIPSVKKVDVELTFSPPWTPDRMSEEAREILGLSL
ncbi:MAG: metal-sulfur cluster assembly factor [Thaumarchaeota archaeon]|nr:metal-sulfur cluster assembly factor [Candidatus Calditenuaceae archaeon]MDW8042273.1 metal-sulfur cluster assembly factor [Nitrososphaerota archaeon]